MDDDIKIQIVMAPRPEKDDDETWQQMIANGLRQRRGIDLSGDFLAGKFVECDSCAAKAGWISLCNGCLANRYNLGKK